MMLVQPPIHKIQVSAQTFRFVALARLGRRWTEQEIPHLIFKAALDNEEALTGHCLRVLGVFLPRERSA